MKVSDHIQTQRISKELLRSLALPITAVWLYPDLKILYLFMGEQVNWTKNEWYVVLYFLFLYKIMYSE